MTQVAPASRSMEAEMSPVWAPCVAVWQSWPPTATDEPASACATVRSLGERRTDQQVAAQARGVDSARAPCARVPCARVPCARAPCARVPCARATGGHAPCGGVPYGGAQRFGDRAGLGCQPIHLPVPGDQLAHGSLPLFYGLWYRKRGSLRPEWIMAAIRAARACGKPVTGARVMAVISSGARHNPLDLVIGMRCIAPPSHAVAEEFLS